MEDSYRTGLQAQVGRVFAQNPSLYDHRPKHPWLAGALGNPDSRIWFVGENPSLGQVERVSDPLGGLPTEEAQWWASKGDQLFRDLLVKHGFKDSPKEAHGGWHCYITNVIKEADYAQTWRGSPAERQRNAARAWAPVFSWELAQSKPILLVSLGKKVRGALSLLEKEGMRLPRIESIQHYSYVALRPRKSQGPMHPERVREYDEEFAGVAALFRDLQREG